jgi:hypothetical protein
MTKGTFHQEGTPTLNVSASNHRAATYMKQKLIKLKGELYKFIIVVGDFDMTFFTLDRKTRQKINKCINEPYNIIKQDKIKIYIGLHLT